MKRKVWEYGLRWAARVNKAIDQGLLVMHKGELLLDRLEIGPNQVVYHPRDAPNCHFVLLCKDGSWADYETTEEFDAANVTLCYSPTPLPLSD